MGAARLSDSSGIDHDWLSNKCEIWLKYNAMVFAVSTEISVFFFLSAAVIS